MKVKQQKKKTIFLTKKIFKNHETLQKIKNQVIGRLYGFKKPEKEKGKERKQIINANEQKIKVLFTKNSSIFHTFLS